MTTKSVDRVHLRLVGGTEAAIELPTVMTEAEWKHLIRRLDAMKEGYVHPCPSPTDTYD